MSAAGEGVDDDMATDYFVVVAERYKVAGKGVTLPALESQIAVCFAFADEECDGDAAGLDGPKRFSCPSHIAGQLNAKLAFQRSNLTSPLSSTPPYRQRKPTARLADYPRAEQFVPRLRPLLNPPCICAPTPALAIAIPSSTPRSSQICRRQRLNSD